ncbi:MAG: peptidyl-prolyl cis-trans isomerase [Lachnospiraceae bacterium]
MIKIKATAVLFSSLMLAGTLLAGCSSIDGEAEFATLDDTEVSMGVANFFARYQQAEYDQYYTSYFGEGMWSSDLYGTGNTFEDDVKSDIVDQLEEMYLLKAHMEDYSIALTEEENAAIQEAAELFMADNSEEALEQVGATKEDYVIEMLTLNTIQDKMTAAIEGEAEITVTDEEAAQKGISYLEISLSGYTDAEGNFVEYTEDEIAGLKSTAEQIASASDIETAVTDAGYTWLTGNYGTKDDESTSLNIDMLIAADELTEGEVSGVIETDSALYIVRLDSTLDEDATAAKKEELIAQQKSDYYTSVLDGWKEETEWTVNERNWAKVNFEDLFTAVVDTETEALTGTEAVVTTEAVLETEAMIETEAVPETETVIETESTSDTDNSVSTEN